MVSFHHLALAVTSVRRTCFSENAARAELIPQIDDPFESSQR